MVTWIKRERKDVHDRAWINVNEGTFMIEDCSVQNCWCWSLNVRDFYREVIKVGDDFFGISHAYGMSQELIVDRLGIVICLALEF